MFIKVIYKYLCYSLFLNLNAIQVRCKRSNHEGKKNNVLKNYTQSTKQKSWRKKITETTIQLKLKA